MLRPKEDMRGPGVCLDQVPETSLALPHRLDIRLPCLPTSAMAPHLWAFFFPFCLCSPFVHPLSFHISHCKEKLLAKDQREMEGEGCEPEAEIDISLDSRSFRPTLSVRG